MREVSVYSNPVAEPGVCAKCGSQNKDWFADLGFDLDLNQVNAHTGIPVWFDGVVYLCCDCINSLFIDIRKRLAEFTEDHYTETELVYGPRPDDPVPNGNEPIIIGYESESSESSSENGVVINSPFG